MMMLVKEFSVWVVFVLFLSAQPLRLVSVLVVADWFVASV